MEKKIERIKEIVDTVKLKYTVYGGDVHFLRIENENIVKIKPTGYCHR